MNKKFRIILISLLILTVVCIGWWYLSGVNIPVLEPKGVISLKEKQLLVFAALLSLIVIVPVFALLFTFAWRYREGNKKAVYNPDLDHSALAEAVWWIIPSMIILVLSIVTWVSSHQLSPYRAIASTKRPITIDVVSLDWKWLFIYPSQNIATVNFFEIPTNVPVDFHVTADGPMNSFWLPQLAGQIYAMPGMSTQLHIMASVAGVYRGSAANITGKGFSGMVFTAKAVSSREQFTKWVGWVKRKPHHLTMGAYNQLAQPSENNLVTYYATVKNRLYDTIVTKYMKPTQKNNGSSLGA